MRSPWAIPNDPRIAEAQAARGSAINNRLEPAPDKGPGFRRDPETGFVFYSSEWLSDGRVGGPPAQVGPLSYPALTRRQKSEGVLAQLRGVGPQTIADIQSDLRMTKREVEDALQILGREGKVEYSWPTTSPLTYQAAK